MIIYDWTVKFKKTHGKHDPLREGLVTDMVLGTHSEEEANNIVTLFGTDGCFSQDHYHDFEVIESKIELGHSEHKLKGIHDRPR